jgi:hypothetical protein
MAMTHRCVAGWFIRSNPESLRQDADEYLAFATEHELGAQQVLGHIYRGWSLAAMRRADEGLTALGQPAKRPADPKGVAHGRAGGPDQKERGFVGSPPELRQIPRNKNVLPRAVGSRFRTSVSFAGLRRAPVAGRGESLAERDLEIELALAAALAVGQGGDQCQPATEKRNRFREFERPQACRPAASQ